MREDSHPGNRGQCPFYINPEDPLTADASIHQCVGCATRGDAGLEACHDDFRQLAYLTILEETPKYDPSHPSKASFITFMKSKVCHSLWSQRRRELKYLSCSLAESVASEFSGDVPSASNPLAAELYRAACGSESLEDEVIEKIQVEIFQERLPRMLDRLSKQERNVVRLKYYQDYTGTQIAKALGISKGRVSQLMKSLLSKLKTAYKRLEDGGTV